MRMIWRLLTGWASGMAVWLLWPAAALAGYCPQLINCTGGSVTTACGVGLGAAAAAALCLPGGEWKDNSDDFGGGDEDTVQSIDAPGDGSAVAAQDGGAGGIIDGIGGGDNPQPPGPSNGGGGSPSPNSGPSPSPAPGPDASVDPAADPGTGGSGLPPIYRDKDGKLIINIPLGEDPPAPPPKPGLGALGGDE